MRAETTELFRTGPIRADQNDGILLVDPLFEVPSCTVSVLFSNLRTEETVVGDEAAKAYVACGGIRFEVHRGLSVTVMSLPQDLRLSLLATATAKTLASKLYYKKLSLRDLYLIWFSVADYLQARFGLQIKH